MAKKVTRRIQLISGIFFSMCTFDGFSQQKIEIGLSYQGSASLLTNKTQNIDRLFNTLHVTKYEGKVSDNQKRLWTTGEIGFNVRLLNKNLEFSGGLRAVDWRYNRDSIIRHYTTRVYHDTKYGPWPSEVQANNYAFSKRSLSTILPFVSASYIKKLTDKSGLFYTISIGYLGLFERKREWNFAYDESLQFHLDNANEDQRNVRYRKKINPYAFDCKLSVDYCIQFGKGDFEGRTGLSYYYAQNGLALHHGMYANVGLSVRFKKDSGELDTALK